MAQQDSGINAFLQQMMGMVQLSQAQKELQQRDRVNQTGMLTSFMDAARNSADPAIAQQLATTFSQVDPRFKESDLMAIAADLQPKADVFGVSQTRAGVGLMTPEQRGQVQVAGATQALTGGNTFDLAKNAYLANQIGGAQDLNQGQRNAMGVVAATGMGPGTVAIQQNQVPIAGPLANLPLTQQAFTQQQAAVQQQQFGQNMVLSYDQLNAQKELGLGEQAVRMAGINADFQRANAAGQGQEMGQFLDTVNNFVKAKASLSDAEISLQTNMINSQLRRLYETGAMEMPILTDPRTGQMVVDPMTKQPKRYMKFLQPNDIQIPGFMGVMSGFNNALPDPRTWSNQYVQPR
jgi:hypothetical protein